MYNDVCNAGESCCDSVKEPVDSMKNTICEIHDKTVKAREMAYDIYRKLFGIIPSNAEDMKVDCAFDALIDINRIERDILETLYAVIERLGD